MKITPLKLGDKVKLGAKYKNYWYTLNGKRIVLNDKTDAKTLKAVQEQEDAKLNKDGEMIKKGNWHEQIVVNA